MNPGTVNIRLILVAMGATIALLCVAIGVLIGRGWAHSDFVAASDEAGGTNRPRGSTRPMGEVSKALPSLTPDRAPRLTQDERAAYRKRIDERLAGSDADEIRLGLNELSVLDREEARRKAREAMNRPESFVPGATCLLFDGKGSRPLPEDIDAVDRAIEGSNLPVPMRQEAQSRLYEAMKMAGDPRFPARIQKVLQSGEREMKGSVLGLLTTGVERNTAIRLLIGALGDTDTSDLAHQFLRMYSGQIDLGPTAGPWQAWLDSGAPPHPKR